MTVDGRPERALFERIITTPVAAMDARIDAEMASLREAAANDPALRALAEMLRQPNVVALLAGVFAGSPYLAGLVRRDAARLQRILGAPPERRFGELKTALAAALDAATTAPEVMRALRESTRPRSRC